MRQAPCLMRVLVVDSSKDGADSLALLLELTGHEVQVAYDGPDALEAASAFQPDVVIAEIALPGIDGYQLAQRLRRQGGLDGVLLVALTGYSQESYRRRSHEAGFDLHLIKPAEPAALQQILARHARAQRARRSLETMPGANRIAVSSQPGRGPWISLDEVARAVNSSLQLVHSALGIASPPKPLGVSLSGWGVAQQTSSGFSWASLSKTLLAIVLKAREAVRMSVEVQRTTLDVFNRSQRAREQAAELRRQGETHRLIG